MNLARRLALVVVCVVCLLVVASSLPAADPRIDTGGTQGTVNASQDTVPAEGPNSSVSPTEGDSLNSTASANGTGTTNGTTVRNATGAATSTDDQRDGPELSFEGALVPGNAVLANVTGLDGEGPVKLFLEGEQVGTATEHGRVELTVPETQSMQVSIPSLDAEWNVFVETDAALWQQNNPVPGGDLEIEATVASEPLSGAAVYLNGEEVASTNEDGNATVTLPEENGRVTLSVERGSITGTKEIDVPELDFDVQTPVLFPGTPVFVEVTAGGAPVEDATISANGKSDWTTGDEGTARVQLPVANDVSLTASVGAARASQSISGIYLRTTVIFVIVPGLVIGSVWTYLRLASKYGFRRRRRQFVLASLFIGFGEVFGAVAAGFGTAARNVRRPTDIGLPSLPRFGSLISTRLSVSLASLLSFGKAPSLGSLGNISLPGSLGGADGGGSSSVFNVFDSGEDGSEDSQSRPSSETPQPGEESPEEPTKREELRAVWHAFLDRIGIEDRETLTPGQAARRAIRAGYPASSVGRLLAIFRTVEYSDREPSAETVATARETAATLADHEPEEESR